MRAVIDYSVAWKLPTVFLFSIRWSLITYDQMANKILLGKQLMIMSDSQSKNNFIMIDQ